MRPLTGSEVRTVLSPTGKHSMSWNENNQFAVHSLYAKKEVSRGKAASMGRIVSGAINAAGDRIAIGTEFGEIEVRSLIRNKAWFTKSMNAGHRSRQWRFTITNAYLQAFSTDN